MTYAADLDTMTMVDRGSHIRAIGWLDKQHEFRTGRSPSHFVRKLRLVTGHAFSSSRALGWPMFLGFHRCNLCDGFDAVGNIGVPFSDILFVAPEMVSHYVEEHCYQPPQEFIDAVMRCAIPGTKDYYESVLRFSRLPETERNVERWYEDAVRVAHMLGADEAVLEKAATISFPYVDDEIRRRLASLLDEHLPQSDGT